MNKFFLMLIIALSIICTDPNQNKGGQQANEFKKIEFKITTGCDYNINADNTGANAKNTVTLTTPKVEGSAQFTHKVDSQLSFNTSVDLKSDKVIPSEINCNKKLQNGDKELVISINNKKTEKLGNINANYLCSIGMKNDKLFNGKGNYGLNVDMSDLIVDQNSEAAKDRKYFCDYDELSAWQKITFIFNASYEKDNNSFTMAFGNSNDRSAKETLVFFNNKDKIFGHFTESEKLQLISKLYFATNIKREKNDKVFKIGFEIANKSICFEGDNRDHTSLEKQYNLNVTPSIELKKLMGNKNLSLNLEGYFMYHHMDDTINKFQLGGKIQSNFVVKLIKFSLFVKYDNIDNVTFGVSMENKFDVLGLIKQNKDDKEKKLMKKDIFVVEEGFEDESGN